MQKVFNVSADCKPDQHYMVDTGMKLIQIREMVDKGLYFTINRARQYGKTTILRALGRFLQEEYIVVSLDFQKEMSDAKFRNENTFSAAFASAFLLKIKDRKDMQGQAELAAVNELEEVLRYRREELELVELFRFLSLICKYAEKPVVLMVDEADSATNNQVFMDFLAQLRGYYIDRDETPTFWSVILAGVYDVKNIKRKLRSEVEHKLNSPWNIAADFLVDMSFSSEEIAGMLRQYEADYCTGMDVGEMAELIHDYTSGYPFLVSKLCKLIDEGIAGSGAFSDKRAAWTKEGFLEAVRSLLMEQNTLFESLLNKVEDDSELEGLLWELLFKGKEIAYVLGSRSVETALMFGFVKKVNNSVVIANRIFEVILYNYFLASPKMQQDRIYDAALKDRNQFVQDGRLNMRLILEKFVIHFDELYGDQERRFYEEDGRRYFLLYLKPIINGKGNYYIESRTRNMERTDIIVDYGKEQFIIELKLWRGEAYNSRGEEQLAGYLDYYHLNKGYMVSFNFNKKKVIGVKEIIIGDKVLIEAVV